MASVIDGKVHLVGVGETMITASQAGNEFVSAAESVTQLLTVSLAGQFITFPEIGQKFMNSKPITLGATANSNLEVTYFSTDETIGQIVEGKLHIVGEGTCVIYAEQAGDNRYVAASRVSRMLVVGGNPALIARTATWKQEAVSTDWNDVTNWSDGQVPDAGTTVIVPTGCTFYPVLTEEAAVADIYLEHGTQLGGQHLLKHENASVGYNVVQGESYVFAIPMKETFMTSFSSVNASNVLAFNVDASTGEATWVQANDKLTAGVAFMLSNATEDGTMKLGGQLACNEVNVKVGDSQPVAFVGNPFMSSIDFTAFLSDNAGHIKNNYQVWTKNGFAGYSPIGTWGVIDNNVKLDNYITPLQGFVVELDGNNTVHFNLASQAGDHETRLLDESATVNKIEIVATNDIASVKTIIAKYGNAAPNDFSSLDARKLVTAPTAVPDIYTMKGSVPVGVNVFFDEYVEYPLVVSSTHNGKMKLVFSGMDNFDAESVTLVDNMEKRSINLTNQSKVGYEFNYDGQSDSKRFIIKIQSTLTDIKKRLMSETAVSVIAQKGVIYVVSPESPVIDVKIYSLYGTLLSHQSDINSTSYSSVSEVAQGVYIVEVETANNGFIREKVLISNK